MSLRTLRGLDLNLLVLFDVLFETGNLTATAKQLGMTQSAASQALSRLRSALDDPLFVRARRGMLPTPRARAVAHSITAGLSLIERALVDGSRFDPLTSDRTFRLAFGNTHCELSLLPHMVARASLEAPGTRLRAIPTAGADSLELLRNTELDLLFDYAPPEDERLAHTRYKKDAMVVIARSDHPRVRGRIGVAQFFEEAHVVLTVASERRAAVERIIQHRGRHRRVIAEAGHYASVVAIVSRSEAIALVPRSLSTLAQAPDRLQVLPSPLRLPGLPVFAIWHRALADDPGHRWLRGLMGNAPG